jgi:nucleoside-diphosphate-sugar epimerase
MTILVTEATGYIGGSVAAQLIAEGRDVRGLVRSEEKARLLAENGVTPVLGRPGRCPTSHARGASLGGRGQCRL